MLWNILYEDSCSVTVTVQCKSKHATNCITGAPVAFKTWCAHQYRVVGLRWLPKLGVENSHADLVEVIQGLRRDLNSKMHVCRGNEEVSTQKIHNIKVESEESFDQSNFFESSQTNKQNMSANTSSYAGTVINGTKQSNDGNKSIHQVPKSGNYPTGHPNNGRQKTRPPPKKKTALVVNQDKNNVEEIEIKGGQHRNQ